MARLLSGPVQVEIVDGCRILSRDLVIDLETQFQDLELWAAFTHHDDGPNWTVLRSGKNTTVVRVKAGFRYDGASIPGWAQSLVMGPKENYEIAGCVHDMLYRLQAPRGVSDSIFHWIARSGTQRVSALRGFFGWATLRLAGWAAYRANGVTS
jgi:hypothetical protein